MQDPEDPEAAAGLLQREGAEQVHQPGRGRRLWSSCSGRLNPPTFTLRKRPTSLLKV
jgi:hypothetical protein